ncbi:hypothetical protein IWZ01DRAFT_541074 [Phyllosticta capitalensis]
MADREMQILPAPSPPWLLSWFCCHCGISYPFHKPAAADAADDDDNEAARHARAAQQHPVCPNDLHPCCARCVRFWTLLDRAGTWAVGETVFALPLPWELLWDCRACGFEGHCWADDAGVCRPGCGGRADAETARYWCDVPPPPLEDDDDGNDDGGWEDGEVWVYWEDALYRER